MTWDGDARCIRAAQPQAGVAAVEDSVPRIGSANRVSTPHNLGISPSLAKCPHYNQRINWGQWVGPWRVAHSPVAVLSLISYSTITATFNQLGCRRSSGQPDDQLTAQWWLSHEKQHLYHRVG